MREVENGVSSFCNNHDAVEGGSLWVNCNAFVLSVLCVDCSAVVRALSDCWACSTFALGLIYVLLAGLSAGPEAVLIVCIQDGASHQGSGTTINRLRRLPKPPHSED